MRQITFACQPSFEKHARRSRREQFLGTMETVVPWSELEAPIEPYHPKAGNGRQPIGLSIMLRIYFLQHWFNLSDPGAEDLPRTISHFTILAKDARSSQNMCFNRFIADRHSASARWDAG